MLPAAAVITSDVGVSADGVPERQQGPEDRFVFRPLLRLTAVGSSPVDDLGQCRDAGLDVVAQGEGVAGQFAKESDRVGRGG